MKNDNGDYGDKGRELPPGDNGEERQMNLRGQIYGIMASGAIPPWSLYLQFLRTKPDEIWFYVPKTWLVAWFERYKSRATIYRMLSKGVIAHRDYPNGAVYHVFQFMHAIGRETE